MSSVYATEPSTSGRVVLETTHGPLEIQLWCHECPWTTKLFLQLCLDGYYNDCVFHRVVPEFLCQTGALRWENHEKKRRSADQKTSGVASAMYTQEYRRLIHQVAQSQMERQHLEHQPRLRFNHRGQVAMALDIDENGDGDFDLQPQFFITLDEASNLDGKHVLFGTIQGPTIFNALRIGRVEIDKETFQPVDMEYAPRITEVKIMENPVHLDIKAHASVPWSATDSTKASDVKRRKRKRKGKKDVNVLSFGDELEEGMEGDGIKSSHDVVRSKTLKAQVDPSVKIIATDDGDFRKLIQKPIRKQDKNELGTTDEGANGMITPNGKSIEPVIVAKETIHNYREEGVKTTIAKKSKSSSSSEEMQKPTQTVQRPKSKSSTSSRGSSIVESRLARYKRRGDEKKGNASKRQREEDTMSKLMSFKTKVKKETRGKGSALVANGDNSFAARMARKAKILSNDEIADIHQNAAAMNDDAHYHGQILEDEDNEKDKSDWLSTTFKCRKHLDHTSRGSDGRDMGDYKVIDSSREKKKHIRKDRSSEHNDRDRNRKRDNRDRR